MDALLTPEQMAEIIGVKLSTIYQWTHQKFIPHVKIGKLVRFDQAAVLDWIQRRSVRGRSAKRVEVTQLLDRPSTGNDCQP
jgi:excisionase family DNA binding protein